MTQTDRMIAEIKRAGLFSKNSDYDGMIGENLEELLIVFQNQGHSGYSANLVATLFKQLIKGDPLSELTSDPSEWAEVNRGVFQSNRVSHVFIDNSISEDPYTLDGKVFSDDKGKTYFTNADSRVHFKLPGFPPKTEYIILEGVIE